MFIYNQLFLYIFTFVIMSGAAEAASNAKKLQSVDFEVYGIVQGVYFRKNTQKEAEKLGLRGWCKNTKLGTVKGVIEGDPNKISDMKNWLQNIGSPSSKIERAEFKNEKEIKEFNFSSFQIKR